MSCNIIHLLKYYENHSLSQISFQNHNFHFNSINSINTINSIHSIDELLEKLFFRYPNIASEFSLPESTSSTISISISNNGQYVASTHGDHTVKVHYYQSKQCIRVFLGHPRTPWTVKFHPLDSNIIASGCLGGEIRIWNIQLNQCIAKQKYDLSIITIAFHPNGQYLMVSSGSKCHVWDWIANLSKEHMLFYKKQYKIISSNYHVYTHVIRHSRTIRAIIFHPNGQFLFLAAPDQQRDSNTNLLPCK